MDSPVCSQCQATSSLMWHKKKDGSILCLECHSNETTAFDSQTPSTSKTDTESTENPSGQNSTEPCEGPPQNGASVPTGNNSGSNSHGRRTRLRERGGKGKQSSRGPEKPKIGGGGGGSASQGTGGANNGGSKSQQQQPKATSSGSRRKQSKQARPQKAPKPQTTVVTSDSVLHKVIIKHVVGRSPLLSLFPLLPTIPAPSLPHCPTHSFPLLPSPHCLIHSLPPIVSLSTTPLPLPHTTRALCMKLVTLSRF